MTTKSKADLQQENEALIAHVEATDKEIAKLQAAIVNDLFVTGSDEHIPVEINRMVFKDSAIADSVGGLLFIEGNRIDGLQGIIDYKVTIPAIGKVYLLVVIRDEDGSTEVNVELGEVTVSNFVIDRDRAADLLSELEPKEVKQLEKEIKAAWCSQYRVDIAIDQATKRKDKELAKRDRRNKLAKKFGTRK